MMGNYAVVDASGIITNIVVWDGASDWAPPAGMTAHAIPDGASGYVIGEAIPG